MSNDIRGLGSFEVKSGEDFVDDGFLLWAIVSLPALACDAVDKLVLPGSQEGIAKYNVYAGAIKAPTKLVLNVIFEKRLHDY